MNSKDRGLYVQQVEETRMKLREKRILENRSHHLHDILEGFEQTIIANLFSFARENGKDSIQTIYVFYAAIRHLLGEGVSLHEWSQEELVDFTEKYYLQIEQLLREQGLSKNMGQRALPILSMLVSENIQGPFNVIELGASSGLIGRALMNSREFLANLREYCQFSTDAFEHELQELFSYNELPTFLSYIGVDLSIPEQDWNLACIEEEDKRQLLQRFLDHFPEMGPGESLVQGDAIQFIVSEKVQHIENPLLVTSMMLYQLPNELRALLEIRINNYLIEKNGFWAQLTYDEDRNRFLARLFGVRDGEVVMLRQLLLKDGDAMEWESNI